MRLSNEVKLTLLGLVLLLAVMPFDTTILLYATSHTDCVPFYQSITDLGLGKWYVWPSGLLFFLGLALWKIKKLPPKFIPAWRAVTLIFFAVAGAGIITDILKRLVARARPVEYFTHHVTGVFHWHEALHGADKAHFVSFPSGHATTVFAFAMALSFLLPAKYRIARILIFVGACILAFSRIMVQAHYPSDVIVGMMVGCLGAVAARKYLARAKWFNAIN